MRKLILAVLLAGLAAGSASASQFTLGASSQSVTLIGEAGTLDANLGALLSGSGLTPDGEVGTYSINISLGTDFDDFGPNNGAGVFPLSASDSTAVTFSFTDSVDGDSTETNLPVTLVDWSNGSTNPHLNFTVPGASGDVILGTLTCSGLTGGTACNIDNVALQTGATASATISSGEVTLFSTVPEPGSTLLLSLTMLAGGLFRKKLFA